MPCFLPTVRVSVPLHRRLAIDADVGPALFWGNREIGQIPDGRAVDAQIRWMRKDRKSNGMGRYWLFGASYAQGRRITRGVVTREYAYRNLQLDTGGTNCQRLSRRTRVQDLSSRGRRGTRASLCRVGQALVADRGGRVCESGKDLGARRRSRPAFGAIAIACYHLMFRTSRPHCSSRPHRPEA